MYQVSQSPQAWDLFIESQQRLFVARANGQGEVERLFCQTAQRLVEAEEEIWRLRDLLSSVSKQGRQAKIGTPTAGNRAKLHIHGLGDTSISSFVIE
jgi:hypothetical protein